MSTPAFNRIELWFSREPVWGFLKDCRQPVALILRVISNSKPEE
jgi:hypothetical protein